MGFLDVGPLELIVIGVVSLLVFGPDRLPEVLGKVGGYVRQFRTIADNLSREFQRELNLEDAAKPTYSYTPPITPPPAYPAAPAIETPATVDSTASPVEQSILPADTGITTYADQPMVELKAGTAGDQPAAAATEADLWAEQDGPVSYLGQPSQPSIAVSAGEPDLERAAYESSSPAATMEPADAEPVGVSSPAYESDAYEPVAYQQEAAAESPAQATPEPVHAEPSKPWPSAVAFDPYLASSPVMIDEEPEAVTAADGNRMPKESGHSS